MGTATQPNRLSYAKARGLADAIAHEIMPGCERIALAGSVRREAKTAKAIELVVIPSHATDLFGNPTPETKLEPILEMLVTQGRIAPVKGGSRMRQYLVPRHGVHLELYLVTPETWGVQLAIRTGPHEFSRKLVTRRCYGGLLRDDCEVRDGLVHMRAALGGEADMTFETPEEEDFLEFCGGWVDPQDRK